MTVLILNPNTSRETTDAMVRIARGARPDLAIEGRTAPFGEAMIVDPQALATGARAVAEMAVEASRDPDVEAVIVAAFGDPGIEVARSALSIPVVGIGEASFLEAGADGRRFAVATTTPDLVAAIDARVRAEGLASGYRGCFLTDGEPLQLVGDSGKLVEDLSAAACRAHREGNADCVIIGGGPLAEAGEIMAAALPFPIVLPVRAAIRRAAMLVTRSSIN